MLNVNISLKKIYYFIYLFNLIFNYMNLLKYNNNNNNNIIILYYMFNKNS